VPTYVYKCMACEYQYETKEGFDAPARQTCERCGAVTRRVLFPPPIVFKGSGFYATDSRKGTSATIGESNTGAATPPSDNKSSDSKPAESKPAPASTSSSDD